MVYAANTRVPVDRSRQEVERVIRRYGCTQFLSGMDFETGRVRVQFKADGRIIRIELDMPVKNEQQCRVRWRALVLVLKAKLEAVSAKITTIEEEFMPFIVLPDDTTVAQHVRPAIDRVYKSGLMPGGRFLLGAAPDNGE